MSDNDTPVKAQASSLSKYSLYGALIVAALAILAGPLHKIGIISFPIAYGLLGLGLIGGAIFIVINLVTIARFWRGGIDRIYGFIGAGVALLVAGFIYSLYQTSLTLPPIHDVTTSITRPPQFVTIAEHRTENDNSIAYDRANARPQREAYPDVKSLLTESSVADAFAIAQKAADVLGWTIVSSTPERGIFEATDRTLWFGFRDDISVRIERDGLLTRVDIRSASRNMESDIASNANRIRRFISEFQDLTREGGRKRLRHPRT